MPAGAIEHLEVECLVELLLEAERRQRVDLEVGQGVEEAGVVGALGLLGEVG
jgi:hypothetical protein